MPEQYQTIYLEPDEEISSVIEKAVDATPNNIILVVPQHALLFGSIINLKLLKSQVEKAGKNIFLSTTDTIGKNLASKAGIVVYNQDPSLSFDKLRVNSAQGKLGSGQIDSEQVTINNDNKSINNRKSLQENQVNNNVNINKLEIKSNHSSGDYLKSNNLKANRPSPIRKSSSPIKIQDIINKKKVSQQSVRFPSVLEIKTSQGGADYWSRSKSAKVVKKEKGRQIVYLLPSFGAKFLIIFAVISIILAGVASLIILPTANLVITPRTEPLSLNLSLVIDKDIGEADTQTNKIPAKLLKIEKEIEQEFSATGKKLIQEKAKGTITIYNEYSSNTQALVENTRFQSKEEGKIFRLTKQIVIPGAKIEDGQIIAEIIDAEAIADEPGEDYNIGPTSFTIPGFKGTAKYATIYGRSNEPMSGGEVKEVGVVSAQDIANAKTEIIKTVKDKIKAELLAQKSNEIEIIENTIKVDLANVTPSVEENQQAEKFTLKAKVIGEALTFTQNDVKKIIDTNITKRVGADKEILEGAEQITFATATFNQQNQLILPIFVEEMVIFKLDPEKYKKDLAGKDENQVKAYFKEINQISKASVTLWPFWVKNIPFLENKINITIDKKSPIDIIKPIE